MSPPAETAAEAVPVKAVESEASAKAEAAKVRRKPIALFPAVAPRTT